MAKILFFAKEDCPLSRQRGTALAQAGNEVRFRNLHTAEWTRDSLRPYLRGRRPVEIMDCRAPAIRSGKIDPLLLSWDEALALLAESPELIKGPLVRVDHLHLQGTEDPRMDRYLRQEGQAGRVLPAKSRRPLPTWRGRGRAGAGGPPLGQYSFA